MSAHHARQQQIAPPVKPQPDGALVKALARAWRWQRVLDEGVYISISDIGDAENLLKSYVSCILRLVLLAPDVVDAILAGRRVRCSNIWNVAAATWDEPRKWLPGSRDRVRLLCRRSALRLHDLHVLDATVARMEMLRRSRLG